MTNTLRLLLAMAANIVFANFSVYSQTLPGTVTLNPASATANVPTTVVATIPITNALVIPSSVNLIKIDASGRSTVVGTMHDDGLNGDAISNDRIFTLRFSGLETSPGTISYRTSAVFRGRVSRVQTTSTSFSVNQLAQVIATRIATGSGHSCAVTTSGGIKCWGIALYGALGNNTVAVNSTTPVDVLGLTNTVRVLSAGNSYTCALTTIGGVKCWGVNTLIWRGLPSPVGDTATPVDVAGLTSGVVDVSAGFNHACALTQSGGVKCWGSNQFGETGDSFSINYSSIPADVVGLNSNVRSVSAGVDHTCAVTAAGGVKCWGINDFGQLGYGEISPPLPNGLEAPNVIPLDVVGLPASVSSVSAGYKHSCALTTSGAVKCWGLVGGSTNLAPRDILGLTSDISAISAGIAFTCALTNTGGVKCFTQFNPLVTNVPGLASGALAISTNQNHACALLVSGGIKCWGFNQWGQLGNGSRLDSPLPVDVVGF